MYKYVYNDPLNYLDHAGLLTEVVIWEPVGWGESSFGHASVNINGTTYTFSPSGMKILPTDQYLSMNDFREGVGLVLNISPEQEKCLEDYLKNYKNTYSCLFNNCTNPVRSWLERQGYDMRGVFLPVSLGNRLIDVGLGGSYNFYPETNSSGGINGPWAK